MKQILLGMSVANVIGLTVFALSTALVHLSNLPKALVASNFIIIPLLIGGISAHFWQGVLTRTRQYAWYALLTTLMTLALSSVILMEGVICLVILFPLLYGFVFAGTLLYRTWISKSERMSMHITPLLLLLLSADALRPPEYHDSVTDTVTVDAPPHVVWRYVPAFASIEQPSPYWLFSLGLARPLRTEIEGPFVGAWRRCVFSGGLTFEERITAYEENKSISFSVTQQPRDPEIFDHVAIERGQMALQDNGDGTTTLVGTTWYQLRAFPAWYFKRWADSIGKAVHVDVMHHIKKLAERDHGHP